MWPIAHGFFVAQSRVSRKRVGRRGQLRAFWGICARCDIAGAPLNGKEVVNSAEPNQYAPLSSLCGPVCKSSSADRRPFGGLSEKRSAIGPMRSLVGVGDCDGESSEFH